MAREIVIYEQIPGIVKCVFLYDSQFERKGQKFPITPSELLTDELKVLFTQQELRAMDMGELSYQIIERLHVPDGTPDRDMRLFDKYDALRAAFMVTEVAPKAPDVEYLDLPEDRTPRRFILDEVP